MRIFRPIELFLLLVFEGAHRLTGNYGMSLIVMSLVVTLVTYPLYRLADIWKKKETDIQELMADDLNKIKAAFTGNKRFYLTQAAYRLYGYKPWYAFRSAAGLLIQIPFFFAAYDVLSSYTGYAGESFLMLRDLSRPDALLLGLNVLPFLMTLVNVVSSVIYTRSLRLKENLQLLILATVFFVLLYDKPSALLLYWTMNNVLSLVKSLLRKGDGKGWLLPDRRELASYKFLLKAVLLWSSFCIHLFLLRAQMHTFVRNMDLLIMALASVAGLLKERFRFISRHSIAYLFLLAMGIIFKREINFSFFRSSTAMIFIIGGVHYFISLLIFGKKDPSGDVSSLGKNPLAFSLLLFLSAMTVLLPQTIYARDPGEVGLPYLSVLAGNLLYFAVVSIPPILLIWKGKPRCILRINTILIVAVLQYIFNAILFPLDAGVLMGFTFDHRGAFTSPNFTYMLKDIGIGTLTVMLACYMRRRQRPVLVVCAVIFLFSMANLFSATYRMESKSGAKDMTAASGAPSELDADAYEKHSFSRTEKNVLYVCLDMFNGTYIDRLRNEMPEFDDKFRGFTWYADTLSVSGWTMSSLPALYGGDGYSPLKNNGNGISLVDAARLAQGEMKMTVERGGYKFSFVDDIGASGESRYYKYYMNKKAIRTGSLVSKRRLLAMIPIFSAASYGLKYYVYDEGFWLVYGEGLYLDFNRTNALRSLSYLDLLPEISGNGSDKGNFLYFRSELTHAPFGINKDGNVIDRDYPDPDGKSFSSSPAAYYSAKKAMAELASYFDWMKENDVYDNTLIVICSDHGNSVRDNGLPVSNPLDSSEQLWKSRASALFMIKPVGSRDPFLADRTSLKSNADIMATICDGLGLEHGFEYHTKKGVRYYSFMLDLLKSGSTNMPYATYRVDGSMFSESSWTRQ